MFKDFNNVLALLKHCRPVCIDVNLKEQLSSIRCPEDVKIAQTVVVCRTRTVVLKLPLGLIIIYSVFVLYGEFFGLIDAVVDFKASDIEATKGHK